MRCEKVLNVFKTLFRQKKLAKVVIIGLDNAGKTSLLHYLRTGQFLEEGYRPTIGANVEELKPEESSWTFSVWDLAGQARFRDLTWMSFTKDASGVVYVVDSADSNRIDESVAEFNRFVLQNPLLSKVPILILCNKADLPESLSEEVLMDKFGLTDPEKVKGSFYLAKCSVREGKNVIESFEWLIKEVVAFNERKS